MFASKNRVNNEYNFLACDDCLLSRALYAFLIASINCVTCKKSGVLPADVQYFPNKLENLTNTLLLINGLFLIEKNENFLSCFAYSKSDSFVLSIKFFNF